MQSIKREDLQTSRRTRRSTGAWASGALLLAGTVLLLSLSFPPWNLWPLALVALTPLTWCAIRRPLSAGGLLLYELAGLAFFLPNLLWLTRVTWPGTVAVAALFLAPFFVLYAVGVQRLVMHLRWPALLAVPLVWVGTEYLRSTLFTGFPWFLLGNSLAPAPLLLQVADVAGVWGVSFFAALTSGWLVDVLRLPLRKGRRFNPIIVRLTLTYGAVVVVVSGYGWFRLGQDTLAPGPRVGVVQKYVPQNVKDEQPADPELDRVVEAYKQATTHEQRASLRDQYERLSEPRAAAFYARQKQQIFDPYVQLSLAAAGQKPDLLAWPETMVPGPLNGAWLTRDPGSLEVWDRAWQQTSRSCDRALTELCSSYHISMLVGADGRFQEVTAAGRVEEIDQNMAVLYAPGGQQPGTYAKRHLVPFGEYVPFRDTWPWLHRQLLALTPYPDREYGVAPGDQWYRFGLVTAAGRTYRFGVPICYEDVMPYPARSFVAPRGGQKQVDFLLTISNDGWYRSAAELDQHLQCDQVRAVENRVPVARAVNGGASGVVDSNGRILALVGGVPGAGGATGVGHTVFGTDGYVVETVPLDSRISLYSRIGDIFPMLCGMLSALAAGWTAVRPRR